MSQRTLTLSSYTPRRRHRHRHRPPLTHRFQWPPCHSLSKRPLSTLSRHPNRLVSSLGCDAMSTRKNTYNDSIEVSRMFMTSMTSSIESHILMLKESNPDIPKGIITIINSDYLQGRIESRMQCVREIRSAECETCANACL